ncbi:MAG: TolC family protein [Acidobacteria bacterium]|nr:TolC family protein [Acidobacteriota bacterium]MCL5288424.1 TolC family protein [Acidobacteriota bacterium]
MHCAKRIVVSSAAVVLLFAGYASAQQTSTKLTLKGAVDLAVQNSSEVKLARARVNVAERTAGVNRSVFLPNLFTGSGAAYTNGFPLGAPQVFNLSYVQTVFNAPLRGQYRASEDRAEIQRIEADRVRDGIILRAASAYLELAKVRHSIRLLREERESSMKIAGVTRERAREGLELEVEVTRAELTAARIAQRILQLEGREDALETDLRRLTGTPAGQRIEVEAEDLPPLPEQPTAELVSLTVANSLDLKQAEFERRAREHVLKGERGGYLPTVDFVGQYGIFTKFNNYDQFYSRFERHNVTIGIQARIPIFASRTNSAVNLARSELNAAQIEARQKRSQLEADVQRQARKSRELEADKEVARLELKLAQENVRVLQAQFDEGRTNLRELEKARLEENDKWRSYLDAGFARQQAQLELLRTTGQIAKVFQ